MVFAPYKVSEFPLHGHRGEKRYARRESSSTADASVSSLVPPSLMPVSIQERAQPPQPEQMVMYELELLQVAAELEVESQNEMQQPPSLMLLSNGGFSQPPAEALLARSPSNSEGVKSSLDQLHEIGGNMQRSISELLCSAQSSTLSEYEDHSRSSHNPTESSQAVSRCSCKLMCACIDRLLIRRKHGIPFIRSFV